MTAASDLKAFEDALANSHVHTNEQTLGADSSVLAAETIASPNVSVVGKIGILITAIAVYMDLAVAHAANIKGWRTQLLEGTQAAMLNPSDPKFIAEYQRWLGVTAAGIETIELPLVFANPVEPMIVVNPNLTILHQCSVNMPDLAGELITTQFAYSIIPLSLETHTARLNAQMNLT